jgi:anthranilate phosphoribosyltransferase
VITMTLAKLLERRDLAEDEARGLMDAVMRGEVGPERLAALLVALRMKGETVDEIVGFARAMREHAVGVRPRRDGLVDTCGTGGDASGTFNISTATALVAAGMGIPVAKHGNRAVSSACGSADVLEALGVSLELPPQRVADLVDEVGLGFMFAPAHHPAMRHAVPVRRALGVRTVFNVLGPLTNPAGVRRQLVGVFDARLCEKLARVLHRLGVGRAFVVHGADGLDEVSLTGETRVAQLAGGGIRTYDFAPEQAGLRRVALEELSGGSARENAAHVEDILAGAEGPRTDAVLLNAGFVAVLADRAPDVAAGVRLARAAVAAGAPMKILEELRAASRPAAEEAS